MSADLLGLIRPALVTCCQLLESVDTLNHDRVITHLESIVSAIEEEDSLSDITWARHFIETLNSCVYALESEVNQVRPMRRGQPKISIPISLIQELICLKIKVPEIATMFGVSVITIRRRMSENNFTVADTYSIISEEELNNSIATILCEHPNTGYKLMTGYLWHFYNIRVTERRIRASMKIVDPVGVYQRRMRNRAIVRRVYFVTYSNEVWHLDTNMKLSQRYKMIIRGCIDGKSRLALYLDIGSDNKATSNLESFMSAITQYGIPSRVRTDKGGENVLIARFMLATRGLNRGSHLTGKSVHNQRIERFWNDVYTTTGYYYEIFARMERDGILNIDEPNLLYILHRVFIPIIQRALNNFRHGWNRHPVSTEHNKIPEALFLLHKAPSDHDLVITEDQLAETYIRCQNYHDLGYFEEEQQDSHRHPAQIMHSFNPLQLDMLNQIDFLQESYNNGVDIFQHCVALLHTLHH